MLSQFKVKTKTYPTQLSVIETTLTCGWAWHSQNFQ